MSKINSILSKRLKSEPSKEKIKALAERSSAGELTPFSGLFRLTSLSHQEEKKLEDLLISHAEMSCDVTKDLKELSSLTIEVKAINNQAAILHGERIKKAQDLLKPYREGAFTLWLFTVYGNRQTPYNFLQYYELYSALPKELHGKIDAIPRQIIYTLASRKGDLEKKEEIIKKYNGESKEEILNLIRKTFPLPPMDKRKSHLSQKAIFSLTKMVSLFNASSFQPTVHEKKQISQLLDILWKKIK